MDLQLAVETLTVAQAVEHSGTQELYARVCAPAIGRPGPASNHRHTIEGLVKRFHPKFRHRVEVCKREAPALAGRLLFLVHKNQALPRLAHSLFHAGIRRVFSAAVDRSLDPGRVGYTKRHEELHARRFYAGLNLFAWSMLAAPLMSSLALLWIAVEVTTIISALLVAIEDTDHAAEAAWKYVLIASAGLGLALLGTVFAYYAGAQVLGEHYNLAIQPLIQAGAHLPHTPVRLAFLLALLGYGTKVGLFPVHTWLPDAHSEAPTPVSALLSGSLLAVSFYAILRYYQVAAGALGPRVPRDVLLVFAGAPAPGPRRAVGVPARGQLLRDSAVLPGRGRGARAAVPQGCAARVRGGVAAARRVVPAGPARLQAAARVLQCGAHGDHGHRGELRRPGRPGRRPAARPRARRRQGQRVHGCGGAGQEVRQQADLLGPRRPGPAPLERPAVSRRDPGPRRDAAVRHLPQRVRDRCRWPLRIAQRGRGDPGRGGHRRLFRTLAGDQQDAAQPRWPGRERRGRGGCWASTAGQGGAQRVDGGAGGRGPRRAARAGAASPRRADRADG